MKTGPLINGVGASAYLHYTKISELENDAQFVPANTTDLLEYYTKEEVETLVLDMNKVEVIYSETQPEPPLASTLYLIPDAEGQVNQWFLVSGTFRQIGTTTITLDNVYTKTEADALLLNKQDELVDNVNIKTVNGQSILGEGDIVIGAEVQYENFCKVHLNDSEYLISDLVVMNKNDILALQAKIAELEAKLP